jgi:acetate kinase
LARTPSLERLEKARKAIETRKHYSEIVKDIFFKDALLNNKSGVEGVPKQLVSLRDIKEEAEKKRLEEFEHHVLMQETGAKVS